jgi:hypothetical protein
LQRLGGSEGDICIPRQISPGSLTSQSVPAELGALRSTLIFNLATGPRELAKERTETVTQQEPSVHQQRAEPGTFPFISSFNSQDSLVRLGYQRVTTVSQEGPKITQARGWVFGSGLGWLQSLLHPYTLLPERARNQCIVQVQGSVALV